MLIQRRDEANQVVVHAGQTAGVIDGVLQDNFVLVAANARVTARTVHGDGVMHAPEQFVRMKGQGEAHPRRVRAPAFARLQVHADIVENLLFVIHHRRAEFSVAHDVRRGVKRSRVGGGHDQTKVVEPA